MKLLLENWHNYLNEEKEKVHPTLAKILNLDYEYVEDMPPRGQEAYHKIKAKFDLEGKGKKAAIKTGEEKLSALKKGNKEEEGALRQQMAARHKKAAEKHAQDMEQMRQMGREANAPEGCEKGADINTITGEKCPCGPGAKFDTRTGVRCL